MNNLNQIFEQNNLGSVSPIYILETNLDDVRGEILGNLFTQLMNTGALDVSIVNTITKKNRPGYLLKVISKKELIAKLTRIIITETGTLGVRIREEVRVCLRREIEQKEVSILGKKYHIHLKTAYDTENNPILQKIEFDDLKDIASEQKKSIKQVEKEIFRQLY